MAVWAGPGSEHFRPVEQGSTLRSAATDFVPVTLRPAASAPVHRPTTLSSMWPFCRAPPGLSAATPAGPQCAAPVMAVSGLHVPDGGQQAASPERQGSSRASTRRFRRFSSCNGPALSSRGLRSRARRRACVGGRLVSLGRQGRAPAHSCNSHRQLARTCRRVDPRQRGRGPPPARGRSRGSLSTSLRFKRHLQR